MPLTPDLAVHRGPKSVFAPGETVVTREGERSGASDSRMDFSIVHLPAGSTRQEIHPKESVWVLLQGSAQLGFAGTESLVHRQSLFNEPPTALHLGPDTPVTILSTGEGSEWALIRTTNARPFPARLFLPADLSPEYRGAGLVQDACLRNVRLIFDRAARPEANLVVGEVVNYPGRWSSYPPHHHDQPEIYHYRFTDPRGYGHAELGDDVVKVRANDTIFIPPGLDHAQVSAPGYGMYYLWMIRHLPGNPYTGFTFAEEHKWTLDSAQQGWTPPAIPQKS
jgi:5-deoxy-glucuronate isomerase